MTKTFPGYRSAAALALLLAGCVTTPVVEGANTETVGEPATEASVTPGFDAEEVAALEARMAQFVSDGQVYGIATRLVHKGEVISDFHTGLRRLDPKQPIQDDTIYRIYSMTKPVTGVALMMLWEEGKFQLDDPVTDYVPEFADLKVLAGTAEDGSPILVEMDRAPTMRELMSHTAGFAYGLGGSDFANTAFRDQQILASPDLDTFIDKVADIPLLFQPGEQWAYSAAVDVQGYIVQQISGQSFGSFLDERLFEPLGMSDTGFYVPEADYDRFGDVFGYHPETGDLVPIPYPSVQFRKETIGMESGGGGLVSTMDDYARFSQMLLNCGSLEGVQILKPETVALMTTNVLPPEMVLFSDGSSGSDGFPGVGFGLEFGILIDPEQAGSKTPAGSYFWGGAAGTWFWIDPVNELYFIGMVQIFDRGGPNEPVDFRGTSTEAVYTALEN